MQSKHIFLLGIFVGFFCLGNPVLANAQTPESPKFAFLVGIKSYDKGSATPIDACGNNVEALSETFVNDYGFKKEDVLSLLDSQATHEAIIKTFRTHLVENPRKSRVAGKEAVIVYYFCGHGSQTDDLDNEETDGKDETFVAWDSRSSGYDILDDEVDDLKFELRQFTNNTTLILESCHSGTGTRGPDGQDNIYYAAEQAKPSGRVNPFKRLHPRTLDDAAHAGTYVAISAANSSQTALSEKQTVSPKPMGLMTKALVHVLKRKPANMTYRGLVREISALIFSKSNQDPQVEGNRESFVFGNAASRSKAYIEIEKIEPPNIFGKVITIRAGAAHGVKPDQIVSVYPPDSVWIANGRVTTVGAVTSEVRFVGDDGKKANPDAEKITISSRVVMNSPAFDNDPVLLDLRAGAIGPLEGKMPLSKQIESVLAKEGMFEREAVKSIGDVPNSAELKLGKSLTLKKAPLKALFDYSGRSEGQALSHRRRFEDFSTKCVDDQLKVKSDEEMFGNKNEEVYYLTKGGTSGPLFGLTFSPADPTLPEKIAESIKRYSYQTSLRTIDNAGSEIPEQFKVTVAIAPEGVFSEVCKKGQSGLNRPFENYDGWIPLPGGTSDRYAMPVNTIFKVTLKNVSGEYYKSRNMVSGMPYFVSVLVLGDNGTIDLAAGNLGGENLNDNKEVTMYFQTEELEGVDSFVVVATKAPTDFSFFRSEGATRSARSTLETLLTRAGSRTRGVTPSGPLDWGVKRFDVYRIERDKK